ARRGRSRGTRAATASGTHGLERLEDVGKLRFGRTLALFDDVRDLRGVEQPHRTAEIGQYRDDLGMVRQVVEGVVRAQQVVGVDAVDLERESRRRTDAAWIRALETHRQDHV